MNPKETQIDRRTLAVFEAAALTVLLQAALDEGKFTRNNKMRAKALYSGLNQLMNQMYKATDDQIQAYHIISNVFEQVIKWSLDVKTLEGFEEKIAKLAKLVEFPLELEFVKEGGEDES